MKKVVFVFMSLLLTFTLAVSSVSAQNFEEKPIERQKVVDNLTEVSAKYGAEILPEGSELPKGDKLEFDTVEEFEAFLATFTSEDTSSINQFGVSSISPFALDTKTPINSSKTITWWAPFTGWGWTGIACWKNIAFNYKYNLADGLLSVSDVTSYLSGITVAISYVQTNNGNPNIVKDNDGQRVNLSVQGYYLLGVVVGGFQVGAKINNTWSQTYVYSQSV